MAGFKIGRATEDIKRELTDILRSVKDPQVSGLLSIVKIDLSSDMSYCKVYVSVLGDADKKAEVRTALKAAAGFIRRELALRLNLRNTPELIFCMDDSIEYSIHMEEMLRQIRTQSAEQESQP